MFDGLLLPSLRSTRPARVELDALDGINRGLLRFYPLLLSGGSVADDISPRRVRGAITNSSPGSVGAVGPHGRAMNFNGSTYMTAGNVGSDIISVSTWARSGITGTPGWNRLVSSKSVYFATEGFEINLVSGSNTKLSVSAGGSSGISPDVVDNWADGRWRHIGVVINRTEISIYINGLLKGSGSASTLTSTSAVMVFGDCNAFNEARWNGGIGNARVYNRALTYAEVQRLYRDPWAGTFDPAERLFFAFKGVSGVTVALTGISLTSSAGTLVADRSLPVTGSAATGSAGTMTPGIGIAASGIAATAAAGTVTPGLTLAIAGSAMTLSAGSVAYSATFSLVGIATTGATGTVSAPTGDATYALTGLSIAVQPGNVKVTGGTKWVPQAARAVAIATAVGNTLPPPPRLTGDTKADIQAQGQWLATLYDQLVKVNNVFGRINDHETRIAALEADNDN